MGRKKFSKININDNSSQSSRINEDETSQRATERTSSISHTTVQKGNTTNTVIIDITKKSVFNYTNFGLTNENFPRWFRALKKHLTTLKLIQYINQNINLRDIDEIQIQDDSAI